MPQRMNRPALYWSAAFLLLLLAINADLSRKPLIEITDYAANSLLVEQARHFRLLTGHYSRWHFHHPGPAYLYLFALGEVLFHDLLRVAPATFNGQIIINIVLNVALWGGACAIFRRQTNGRFSVSMAMAVTVVVAVLVNRNTQPSMLISNWMPDVLPMSFLLFLVSAASVAADDLRDLPVMALSGMLLVHAHVAECLFVGLIGGGTVAWILARAVRPGRLRGLVRENRRSLVGAVAICAIFLLPIALELSLDRPNNLDDLRAYLAEQGGARNSLATSAGYFVCLLAFVPNPEMVLPGASFGETIAVLRSHPAAILYWLFFAMVSVGVWLRRTERPPLKFPRRLLALSAAAAVLFLYWGMRITGPLYAFNGRFIYAIHLALWFVVLAEFGRRVSQRQLQAMGYAAAIFALMFAMEERDALRSKIYTTRGPLDAALAAPRLPGGELRIAFEHDDWPWAMAVANQMARMGKPFCVSEEWGFMASRAHVCRNEMAAARLAVAQQRFDCAPPCRMLYRGRDLMAAYIPLDVHLPVEIGFAETDAADFVSAERIGFHDSAGTYRGTGNHATIRFPPVTGLPDAGCFSLVLKGFAFPGRTVQVSMNERPLGTWTRTDPLAGTMAVPREAVRTSGVNMLALDASPPVSSGNGFGFMSLELKARDGSESCPAGAEPVYDPLSHAGPVNLLWQYADGGAAVWFMGGVQGDAHVSTARLPARRDGWRIAAVADLNRDGHPDLIWQDPASGRSEVWFLGGSDGATLLSTAALAGATTWRIVAAADFNHDGHADLVWQDPADGHTRIEYRGGPQGTTALGRAEVTARNVWRIVAAADFDGDGNPDLVWQDPVRGGVQIWYMSGEQGNAAIGAANIGGAVAGWRIAAVADFNRDGHPDLAWQDARTGASRIWFLSGAQGSRVLGTAMLSGSDAGRIVGAR